MSSRKFVRSVALAVLAGITAFTPFASQHASAHSPQAKVTTLVVGWDVSEAKTFDPGREYEFSGELVDHSIYDSLVTIHGSSVGNIQPDLATSWKVTGGGTVFTFKLRQGVKFVSGNPLTADDVVFSYLRFKNLNDNPAPLIAGMKSITALDPSTVQITLSAPDVSFLAAMTSPNFGVLDSKTVMAHGGNDAANASKTDTATAYLNANSAGTGPYVLKSWTPDTNVVLARNPDYWGPAPYFQQVILDGVKDGQTQALQLQKGDAQMAFGLTIDQANAMKSDTGVKIDAGPTLDYAYLAMNVSPAISKPLSSPLVRQAIRYAIDYNGIIKQLLSGDGLQVASVVPIGYVGNSPSQNAANRIVTNVAKAKALLAQAGYPNGFTVSLTYPTNYNFDGIDFDSLAAKIINDLKGVGIIVTPKAEQVSLALAEYRAKKSQINLEPWGADYPDAYDNLSYFGPGGGEAVRVNYMQDDDLPALVAKGDATADTTSRGAIYDKVQQQLLKTGPWAVLVQPEFPVGLRANIKGFQYAPIWRVDVAALSE